MWAYFAHYDMPDDDPTPCCAGSRSTTRFASTPRSAGGSAPTIRLQRALGREGEVRPHDYALSVVHWSWFLVPHGSLAYILLRHPGKYPRAAVLMAACFDLGCVVYWAVPTAPPGGPLATATCRRCGGSWPRRASASGDASGARFTIRCEGNPFAAMPSLHFGTSVMAARVLSTSAGGTPAIGWAYALTLGFGLVYLGEHYVVDLRPASRWRRRSGGSPRDSLAGAVALTRRSVAAAS